MLTLVEFLLWAACVFGVYLMGVARGARWGRRVAAASYDKGRDDAIRYLMQ